MVETLLLMVSAVLAWWVWITMRSVNAARRPPTASAADTPGGDELDEIGLYGLAYLAGGTERMVHTALTVLLHSDAIRVNQAGWISAVAGSDPPGEPIERAIMDVLSRAGSCSARRLVEVLAKRPEPARVRAKLEAQSLLIPDDPRPRLERALKRVQVSSIGAAGGCGVTLALVITGIVAVEPRTIAALLIGAAAGLIGWMSFRTHRSEASAVPFERLTERAKRILAMARRRQHPPQRSDTGIKLVALVTAFAVAVNDLPAAGDPRMRRWDADDSEPGTGSSPGCSSGETDSDRPSIDWSSCSSGSGSSWSSGGDPF